MFSHSSCPCSFHAYFSISETLMLKKSRLLLLGFFFSLAKTFSKITSKNLVAYSLLARCANASYIVS